MTPSKFQITIPAALLALMAAACYGAPLGSALDQFMIAPVNLNVGNNATRPIIAQTVVAGRSGKLTGADLFINRSADATDPFFLTIRTVDLNGFPTSNVIASQTIPSSAVKNGGTPDFFSPDWVSILFSSPVEMSAGTPFALTLEMVDAGGGFHGFTNWNGSTNNPYPHGSIFYSSNGTSFTALNGGYDVRFRTFVSLPEPCLTFLPLLLLPTLRRRNLISQKPHVT